MRRWPKMAANTRVIIARDKFKVLSQSESENWSMNEVKNSSMDQASRDYHLHRLLLPGEWGTSFFAPSAFSAFAVGVPHPWAVCQVEIDHDEQSLDQGSFLYVGSCPEELRSAFFSRTSCHFWHLLLVPPYQWTATTGREPTCLPITVVKF